jgi:NADPH2:quinone reductase
MRAVQITEFGGPEVLNVVDLPDPVPGDGEQLYEVSAAGVNYADTHQTENSYLSAQELPLIPGTEFVGRSGDGRRVVGLAPAGGYAQKVVAHPRLTWELPESVSDEQALALVVQGATAWHLLRTSTHMQPGETVVVIAGAGGVGSLAVQLAKRWGAGRVIATASSPEKRALTEELGADASVDPALADGDPKQLTAALREANGGTKVDIVLEMTGGNCLRRLAVGAGPLRPARLLRHGRPGAAEGDPGAVPDGHQPRRHRLLAGALHEPARDDGRGDGGPPADGRRRRPEAGRRRAVPDDRRPRGAPGPAVPPHHRQADPRPLPLSPATAVSGSRAG